MKIFEIVGNPANKNYLFLGNYVTRGHFGVETITLLICLKLRFPNRVTLLRGSHDSRLMTQV